MNSVVRFFPSLLKNERLDDGGGNWLSRLTRAWSLHAREYWDLIESDQFDSRYLRETGLIPNLVEMIGDCSEAVMLDAGTGTGWLFDHIRPKQSYACDVVEPKNLSNDVVFRFEDVNALSFASDTFDIIVASLLLLYCNDLERVCREFHRVAKRDDARLIVVIMHPYFYRTGETNPDGTFLLTRDLSHQASFEFKIGNEVGPFRYYYRPLPDYLNTLIRTGWDIVATRDWFIDLES